MRAVSGEENLNQPLNQVGGLSEYNCPKKCFIVKREKLCREQENAVNLENSIALFTFLNARRAQACRKMHPLVEMFQSSRDATVIATDNEVFEKLRKI